jgi:hypothetical protein
VKDNMSVTISRARQAIVVDREFDISSEEACGQERKNRKNNRVSQR